MLYGFLWIADKNQLEDCFFVRKKVFMEEQGFANEVDEIDDTAHHLLFLDDDKPIATARLFPESNQWHIGRVCTLKEYRGKGIGRFLIQECVKKAKELGKFSTVSLGAQVTVQGFYEKLGFYAMGEVYLDEYCPHIHMEMKL